MLEKIIIDKKSDQITDSSPYPIQVGYDSMGVDHLLRNLKELKRKEKRINITNIDEVLEDGVLSNSKLSTAS